MQYKELITSSRRHSVSDQPAGGVANWSGADFELRLGVQFCVYMLVGDLAGLAPGAVSQVQPQAPEVIDDLVVSFETGAQWAIQAKAGGLTLSWKPSSRFAEALRQLYTGAVTKGQIDLAPGSLDRVELAVDDRAASRKHPNCWEHPPTTACWHS
jgi:hypothetical protein